jgi:hypothetical protein
MAKTVDMPEIWAIWLIKTGRFLAPIDDDGTEVFQAWPTEAQARQGAQHQHDQDCLDEEGQDYEIVRVK